MRFKQVYFIFILFSYILNCTSQNLSREQRIAIQKHFSRFQYQIEPADALIVTDKILAIDSSNARAIAYRAIAFFRLKNYQAALENFNLYLKKKPNSSFCINRAQLKAEMKDTIGALLDIDRALSVSGYDPAISDQAADFLGPDKRLEKHFEKVIKLHPENFTAFAVLGLIKEKQNDYKGASEKYNIAVKCLDNDLFQNIRTKGRWLFRLKSSIDFKLKRFPEAIDAITQTILLYPENASYYKDRMKLYLAIGEQDKACADLWQLQKFGKAPFPYESKCDSTKTNCLPSKDWLRRIEAEKFYLQGSSVIIKDSTNYKKAIYYYSKALEFKPDHIYALACRAYNYILLNQLDKEILDLNEILKNNPESAITYNYRAGAKRDMGYFKEAFQDANNAIRLDSTRAEYWVTRASISTRLGDTTKALTDLSKAIELNPNNSIIYFERGLIELEFKDNAKSSLIDLLKAIEIEENKPYYDGYPTYYNNCAMAYNKLMLYDEALEQLEKAIALKPNYALYYFRCGEIKARMKNMDGACKDWNIAKQLGYKDAEEVLLYNCTVDSKEQR